MDLEWANKFKQTYNYFSKKLLIQLVKNKFLDVADQVVRKAAIENISIGNNDKIFLELGFKMLILNCPVQRNISEKHRIQELLANFW